MTLATVGPTGEPQAAAVFYAADEQLNLYFLSSPRSRHSENLAREPRIAATIHADKQSWQTIQGVQIEGTAHIVRDTRQIASAIKVYASRFDFLQEPLAGSGPTSPAALRGPVANSRFYVLNPTWIRLIDNQLGFGHKEELWMQKDRE
jgi:uncharacterized protein YhbP (UPF0306 family)